MNKISFANNFIYEFDIDPELSKAALDFWLHQNLEIKNSYGDDIHAMKFMMNKSSGNFLSVFYKPLFDQLTEKINEVAKLHFEDVSLVITESWLTRAEFGQSRGPHYHYCSVFSGLLYLTDHPKSETVFLLDDPFYNRWLHVLGPGLIKKDYTLTYTPKIGKLLIWDSFLPHKIKGHTDKKTRHTLAFNSWFDGMISDVQTSRLVCKALSVEDQINDNKEI